VSPVPSVATLSDRFVGTWRLVSFVGRGADGRETSTYGSKPHGVLIYDKGGRMSVQIARSDRRPFTSGDPFRASPEELKDAFEGYFGYFGRYTVHEKSGTVTHHIEGCSYPNFVGTDQLRLFTWQNDCLVLSTPPEGMGGSDVTYLVATWERQP
jgi:Lipocalin-like domain